jgi:hypothetical protein
MGGRRESIALSELAHNMPACRLGFNTQRLWRTGLVVVQLRTTARPPATMLTGLMTTTSSSGGGNICSLGFSPYTLDERTSFYRDSVNG